MIEARSMRDSMNTSLKRSPLASRLSKLWAVALVALALCAAVPATQAYANPLDAIASFFGIGAAADPAANGELGGVSPLKA